MLANSNQWFGNGTFKLCPQMFSQMYKTHALVNHEVLPCVFALQPSKTLIVFEPFFHSGMECSQKNNNGKNPDEFPVFFETTAIKAIRNVLQQTDMSSCFFHLSLNLQKHIQCAGLQERYMSDPQFGLKLRIIPTLAFVSLQDVINSFEKLCVVIRNQYHRDFGKVVNADIENTYIGHFQRNPSQRLPLFLIELWNMFTEIAEELQRTINNIISWRNSLQVNVLSTHSTFLSFQVFF